MQQRQQKDTAHATVSASQSPVSVQDSVSDQPSVGSVGSIDAITVKENQQSKSQLVTESAMKENQQSKSQLV